MLSLFCSCRYTARQVLTNAQDIPRAMTTAGQMLGMTPAEAAMQPAAALLMGLESLTLVEGGGASFVKGMAMHALQHAMTQVLSLPWGAATGPSDAANALSSRLAAQQRRQLPRPPSEEYESSEGEESEEEETEGGTSDESGSEEEEEQSVTGSDYSASSVTETSTATSGACEVTGVEDMTMRLQTLRLVNVSGLTMGSLALLMRHALQLKKLELCGCPGVTLEWIMQARIDAGRRLLTIDFAGV